VIWCISIYFMVYFQHPSDSNTATFPKIMAVLALSLATSNVLLLPLDVAQRSSPVGGIPMDYLWLCIYCLIALLSIIVLPFTIFFYEADDPDNPTQCVEATRNTFILLLIVGALFAVGYIFLGFADVPIDYFTAPLIDSSYVVTNCNGYCSSVNPVKTSVSFVVSVITFLITILAVFGWILLVVFGGIGMIALPIDLVNSFRERPNPISEEVYKKRVVTIGERAEALMKQGLETQKGSVPRKVKNQWKTDVWGLIREYDMNEVAFKKKGGAIIVYFIKLVLGIFGGILTLLWIVQICIWTNTGFYPFINYMLIAMTGIWQFFGVLFFGIFAYWMLWCLIAGNYKWGIRVPLFFTIHPMKPHETLLSSMLVNFLLILVGSVAVVDLCAKTFSEYARVTVVNSIFNVAIRNLRGLYWFWYVIQWVLIGVAGLAVIYFIFRPTDRDKKFYMEAQARRH